LISKNSTKDLRVHTFGIGAGASSDLIKNAAINGNGMFYFIDDPNQIE
jgi:secreted protein with Ig-like and vWFA domain